MAEAVTTNNFRQRLAARLAGGAAIASISHMAFGNGGHNSDNSAKAPSASQTALNNELLRKVLLGVSQEDAYSVTGTGRIGKTELVGYAISEAALIDANGKLIGVKNFSPKIKDSDEEYDISIQIKF